MVHWGLGLLGAVLDNTGGAGAAQIAAGFPTDGLFLKFNGIFLTFSLDDECESNKARLQILWRAGWDGRGMVELIEILRRESSRDPDNVEVFFSSHCQPQDRIARRQAEMAKQSDGRRDSGQFQSIKARHQRMPAPCGMPRS